MTLSTEQVAHFRREGYLAVPNFFGAAEVAALRGGLAELKEAGVFSNVATEGDGATASADKQNLQICPLACHHRFFAALVFHPRVRETVPQLVGHPAYKFLDQIFLKPARVGVGTNWHQDNAYFDFADPMVGTAMWIAIHDATLANGTIRVIPRAFERLMPHRRDPDSDHHTRCHPADEGQAVPIELEAGGVLFFCFGTPHATTANNTDRERAGLSYHFLAVHNERRELLALDQPNRPELKTYGEAGKVHGPILSGPDYSAGLSEYGCDMEAVLAAETERLAGDARAAFH